ncbi:hypothetical protein C496_00270 [Natronorubrum tibetense GA33]|uniref:Uncharacterized protein n=1 Tax=Natronorubrum tibetense GA33 TaxID=1114856 RepID=L9WBL0_9EURY|nr:hypothetical protein C496_00270 [Natronorubrum tibetense GA33]
MVLPHVPIIVVEKPFQRYRRSDVGCGYDADKEQDGDEYRDTQQYLDDHSPRLQTTVKNVMIVRLVRRGRSTNRMQKR